MRDENYLFANGELEALLREKELTMFSEIESLEDEQLGTTDDEEIANLLIETYKLETPRLLEGKITQKQEETQVDVSQDFDRGIIDRSRPHYISGTKITFYIPFEGNGELFHYQSSMINMSYPQAEVRSNELLVSFSFTRHDVETIKKQLGGTLGQINQLLTGTSNDINIYNEGLKQKAVNRIKMRREKIQKDKKFAVDLGYPSHE
jgi:hypothetical protein